MDMTIALYPIFLIYSIQVTIMVLNLGYIASACERICINEYNLTDKPRINKQVTRPSTPPESPSESWRVDMMSRKTILPSDKDSIYFLADKLGDSFNIRWHGEAASFMKRV